jgi:hypothetical protein
LRDRYLVVDEVAIHDLAAAASGPLPVPAVALATGLAKVIAASMLRRRADLACPALKGRGTTGPVR